jgi:MOSC domain-containing protein
MRCRATAVKKEMEKHRVGIVKSLMRYPVKSMLGESLDELEFTLGGALGDRAYALREVATGRVISAKKWAKMFEFQAAYEAQPAPGSLGPVRITLPGGAAIHAEDPEASGMLSSALGRKVTIERAQINEDARAGIDPATVFGDVPVDKVLPGLNTDMLPDNFGLARGTFFDSASVHVLASGTLEQMRRLCGEDARMDPRRFRPNIYVQTVAETDGFVEDQWLGGTLEVGETLRIVSMMPALRCVMTTLAQADLESDLRILRTAAFHHKANAGVFASIGVLGKVRVGDPVFLAV